MKKKNSIRKNGNYGVILFRFISITLCAVMLVSFSASAAPGDKMSDKFEVSTGLVSEAAAEKEYGELLAEYSEKNYASGTDSFSSDSWTGAEMVAGYLGYSGQGFAWLKNEEEFSISVDISEAGLYVIAFDYITYSDDASIIQRGLKIDGESLCASSDNCPFLRSWEEKSAPEFDANGDETAPSMQQINKWGKQYLYDTNALYSTPLKFYFSAGKHTVTLTDVSGKVGLGAIYVEPVPTYSGYSEYKASHSASEYNGDAIVIEAETAAIRSERTIRRLHNSDPASSPYDYHSSLLNAIGGERWQSGWQSITWEIDVPETAYYRIDMRVLQNTGEGLTVYRQLRVDGAVPFEEALALPFSYEKGWQTVSIGGDNNYYIYLEKGIRSITLCDVSGELGETITTLKKCSADLSALLMDISTIVGTSPDTNFDYQLQNKISWLIPTLTALHNTLNDQAERLTGITGRQTTLSSNLFSSVKELEGYINNPKTIPNASGSEGSLTVMQTNLATWYGDLLETPMTIDTITLSSTSVKPVQKKSSFWQRCKATWINFISSFVKDYDSIGSNDDEASSETISVWIARGREWGEALQKMCDDEYTMKTGVRVKINILPTGSVGVIGGVSPVLLSLVSGNAPNIAIGSDSSTPVELAIRDSAVDLSKMPGYDELEKYFVSGALEPLKYNGGVYALPETMDFQFMFYRSDIMQKLNLSLPDTWDQLYSKVLPTLKQNNYDFYLPITTSTSATYQYCAFYTYLYQRGGDIYSEDGLSTLLNTDLSYAAFSQWIHNYTRYNLPREINMFNHFRTGDIPLFVGGLNEYLTLKVAAPELYGKWGISLIPGTEQSDGTVNRSSIGALTTCVVFDKGEQANNASWDFLKWYMSSDVQYRYGDEIEAAVGLQARWFTANTEAFNLLSWESKDLKVFNEAMQWMRNPRNVLGGYITGRQLNNAWTRAVLGGQDEKEALEDAIREINKELVRKQEEYGIGGVK